MKKIKLDFFSTRYKRMNSITTVILLGIILLWVYPFLWILFASFKSQREMFVAGADLWPKVWDFSNYGRAWLKADFQKYFFNSLTYSIVATVIELIKSSSCGYVLARYRFPGRDVLYSMILATLFIPIATIIIPQFLVIQKLGLLNTRAGVILALSGGAGALYVLLFTNFFKTIPNELFDSMAIDGANFFQTFRNILPLAQPVIATVVIFNFLRTWNEFNIPLIFTFSRPELRTMAVGMYAFQGEHSFDWTGFASGTMLSIIPVLIVFLLFQNYFVRGLSGSVKE